MRKNFIKVQENFTCELCGTQVKGTGYTNHCPNCLYSKHVDDQLPGDRTSKCLGLMEPVSAELKKGQFIIHHRCLKCGKNISNKASLNDNQDLLIKLSLNPSSRGES